MYSLIITEKPDAASRIAAALDLAGNPQKIVITEFHTMWLRGTKR
jgi:hypothetical protein